MVFAPGPIFANIVLADEINRTPPKTQSALLEAMQEHRVTIQGRTYKLEEPFYVFATQNPIELEGTYPLPEAQLDRFMFHIVIDHPPEDEELEVIRTTTAILEPQFERPVTGADLVSFQRLVRRVPVADPVLRYALAIVRASRPKSPTCPETIKKWVAFGGSVRAAQYLVLGGKARALTSGRYHVSFDDIRALAHPVLRHRVLDELPRAVRGCHERRCSWIACSRRCRCRGPACSHGRQPCSRRAVRRSGGAGARRQPRSSSRAPWWTASSTASTARRSSAPRSTSPSTVATCRATTSGASTGRCSRRTDKYFLKEFEADSNANFSVLLDVSKSMAFGDASEQARLRQDAGGLPDVSRAHAARPGRPGHLRSRGGGSRAAVGQAPRRRAAHAGSGHGRAARRHRSATEEAGGALRPPRHRRRGLGLLRRARRDLRGGDADPLPRQRRDPLPRARPGGGGVSRSPTPRRSRTSRAATSCRWSPTRSASSIGR